MRFTLKPSYDFEVEQAGCEPVGNGVSAVGEVFYELIGNRVLSVDQVEHFEAGPDAFTCAEWAVAAAHGSLTKQERAEANVYAKIGFDDEAVPVAAAVGDIIGYIAAIQHVQVNFEVFVCGQIVFEVKACCNAPVGRPAHEANIHPAAVNSYLV